MTKNHGARRVARASGVLMLWEAITLGVASYLHMQGRIPLGFTTVAGEDFRAAATPEAVIGAVLAAAGTIVVLSPRAPRWIPVAATVFAIVGAAVGMTVLLGGTRSDITVDMVYHSALMAALLATLAMLLRPRPAAAAPAAGARPESGRKASPGRG